MAVVYRFVLDQTDSGKIKKITGAVYDKNESVWKL